jgi:hypothetical protein
VDDDITDAVGNKDVRLGDVVCYSKLELCFETLYRIYGALDSNRLWWRLLWSFAGYCGVYIRCKEEDLNW